MSQAALRLQQHADISYDKQSTCSVIVRNMLLYHGSCSYMTCIIMQCLVHMFAAIPPAQQLALLSV